MSEAKLKQQLLEMDLYKLLECEETCSEEQLKKAYRKRALEVHPDKNPDKKEEAEKAFIQLGKAFEILTDKSARSAYDAARRAKREKAARDSQMDAKRREMKEKLESREKAARERAEQQAEKYGQYFFCFFPFKPPDSLNRPLRQRQDRAEEAFYNEIERVRKENRRLLEEENNKIFEQLRQEKLKRAAKLAEKAPANEKTSSTVRIKVTWPVDTSGMSQEFLESIFTNYGQIENLILGSKANKPSALLEFKRRQDAVACLAEQSRLNDTYSIQLKCLDNLESSKSPKRDSEPEVIGPSHVVGSNECESFEDMEARILKKMRATKADPVS